MSETPLTRHVTAVFRTASAMQLADGIKWYADAHEFAAEIAEIGGVTVDVAAGVIAALSPLNSWGHNQVLARRFMENGGLTAGYLPAMLAKARAIYAGADILATLNGQKITNFYRSILSAGADGVCIDRHAFSIAHNVRTVDLPSLSGKRYAAIAETYVKAAAILTRETGQYLSPAVVQAVTWTVWRNRYWAAGAFDA
jgi:hypothetical protein